MTSWTSLWRVCRYAECVALCWVCRYAECVVMLSVFMLNVVAPKTNSPVKWYSTRSKCLLLALEHHRMFSWNLAKIFVILHERKGAKWGQEAFCAQNGNIFNPNQADAHFERIFEWKWSETLAVEDFKNSKSFSLVQYPKVVNRMRK